MYYDYVGGTGRGKIWAAYLFVWILDFSPHFRLQPLPRGHLMAVTVGLM